ncbi:hypothetical protein A3B45_01150 [Candidatus Daviesbacteria bacterium RIFCSPLOWO2_01_FULL_39_12]|uniref:LytR/CpsA/Psr regulator C-terminal domain-containing protein n=1 Tax=Candidatus Daviesbacteria bacterium RIFCSPLOWO2_01_FULL_39_12 TaxID=1797785 RepID=A0A1F5KPP9_9BACT|nr:MAG: hypothetical protein A3B45_01150 [Candidatus Daviesbacteria bacterium RIFCSPLOWO2_01_FULL_39_12]
MSAKSATKKIDWRDTKNRLNKIRNLKLGLVVLGLIVGILILGQLINFVKIMTSPLNFVPAQKYFWDGQFNLNLVIQTSSTSILNFNPQEEKALIVSLPDNLYLDVPGGYGSWMLGSIYNLGESTQKGQGPKLIKTALSSLFGIPIDGYLRLENHQNYPQIENLIEEIRQNPFSGMSLFTKISSDLTPLELMRLKLGLIKVRFDKINYLDLTNLAVLDTKSLADSTTVFMADSAKLDTIFTSFIDPKIRAENLSIAVFNATDYPQLAQKAKRIIANLGGNVIIVSNYPKQLKKTIIWGEESASLKRLTQIFSPCREKDCDKIDFPETSSRAQINIFLGEDFAQAF